MKRVIIIVFVIIAIVVGFFAVLFLWTGATVKGNISTAQEKYGGSPEAALISYLMDERNSAEDRSHIAIWTLGQIHSDTALPMLRKLYKNDPQGVTCHEKHDSLLCQYEIRKAIDAIENKPRFSHSRLKGSN